MAAGSRWWLCSVVFTFTGFQTDFSNNVHIRMENQSDDLETQCEDAVFQICCTRESYSARCAKHLEKYLGLVTKKQTAKVQTNPAPNFDKPLITERQEKLFDDFVTQKNDQSAKKHSSREALSRVKELKSILNQIESSRKTEMLQLLQQ